MRDLEAALGQYQIYRSVLEVTAPEYELYLAIRDTTYARLNTRQMFKLIVQRHQLALLIVDTDQEEIVQWIK